MESIMKQLKSDCNRYVDINNVLQKMVEKKYIQQIQLLFDTIFREEQAFTVQGSQKFLHMNCIELTRLMRNLPKDRFFDMNLQFKMNTQIFKTNFEVIVNNLMSQVWNKVQQSFTENNLSLNMKQHPTSMSQYQTDQLDVSEQFSSQSPDQQINQRAFQTNPNIQSEAQQNRQQQRNKPMQRVMSYENITDNKQLNSSQNKHNLKNDSWVRKSLKRSGLSDIHSNTQQIQSQDISTVKQQKGNLSFSMYSKTGKQRDKDNLNMSKKSISSMKSFGSQGKLGGQVPFSELSVIRGGSPNSFMKAPRELDKTSQNLEYSPGPMDYNIDKSLVLTRKQSPSSKFNQEKRQSWIDEKLKYDTSCQSPGPQYNTTKVALSKPLKKQTNNNKKK